MHASKLSNLFSCYLLSDFDGYPEKSSAIYSRYSPLSYRLIICPLEQAEKKAKREPNGLKGIERKIEKVPVLLTLSSMAIVLSLHTSVLGLRGLQRCRQESWQCVEFGHDEVSEPWCPERAGPDWGGPSVHERTHIEDPICVTGHLGVPL